MKIGPSRIAKSVHRNFASILETRVSDVRNVHQSMQNVADATRSQLQAIATLLGKSFVRNATEG
jgi:hypothetical protein